MTEPIFFERPPGLTAGEIVAMTGAKPMPGARLDTTITNIASLEHAGPGDLVYVDRAEFLDAAAATWAGICLTTERFAPRLPSRLAILTIKRPYVAFVQVARSLFPGALRPLPLRPHGAATPDQARIDPTARLETGVIVDPGAVIGAHAEIGSGTVIGANCVIGTHVRIGRDCSIGPGVTLECALIGNRVFIHPGAHIGQDGFGYVPRSDGHLKVPQIGRVIIQDDVEIGAGTTIDRGASRDTTIGEGTKIDNLVQIGHNCVVGRHCLIAGQCGLSGSVTLGDYVMLGGKVGIADHLTIGEGAQIAAAAGVMDDVPAGAQYAGAPAKPIREFFREVSALTHLTREKSSAREAGRSHDSEG